MSFRHVRHGFLERMLRIHEELQRGASVNCSSLGRLLEVSRKTLVRDINYMRDRLQLPVEFDPVHNTYRYTEPVMGFPTLQVSEGEVFALLVAQKALEQYRGTPFHRQLAASFEKLAAGLKETVSFSPTDELQSVSFKNIGSGKSDAHVFSTLSRGLMKELVVAFDYRKPGAAQVEHRQVQPYHLSHRDNLWYLVGFDIERNALRTFALPRISNPEITKTAFKRPEDFSPDKFFANALGVLGGDRDYQVVIRFRGDAADRVREREWHHTQKLRTLADGGLELKLRLGALPEIERWILTWGPQAEVVEPKELREKIAKSTREMAKLYQ